MNFCAIGLIYIEQICLFYEKSAIYRLIILETERLKNKEAINQLSQINNKERLKLKKIFSPTSQIDSAKPQQHTCKEHKLH